MWKGTNQEFTFIDLFAGIGGFEIALNDSGGECLGFSEINKDAIDAYCTNLGLAHSLNLGDIRNIKALPPHDILTAGVPCQSWSIAGKNLGFDDDRGQLWNDTIFLLKQSKPKAFIFENVKGLVDPRNKNALSYIMKRIRQAGYYASFHVINSYDHGVPQNRIRVYIVGFKEKEAFEKFSLPKPASKRTRLGDILGVKIESSGKEQFDLDLFGRRSFPKAMSLSSKNGFNDYFLFNDIRNGSTTIHSWDILETSDRQKEICQLLLRNRRKKLYGKLDGNPLSLKQLQDLDPSISQKELNDLVALEILTPEEYKFSIRHFDSNGLTEEEVQVISTATENSLIIDEVKHNRNLRLKRIPLQKILESLKDKGVIRCEEIRYDFKNTKISTGLFGVNRIFLPNSDIFPTLVASDTNDYITLKNISATDHHQYKERFIEQVYKKGAYRKITKGEACLMQGFPEDFILPESRSRWMKLLGNSVSVPVIKMLVKAIIETGAIENEGANEIRSNVNISA